MLAALMGSSFGNDPLGETISADQVYVSSTKQSFTLEKRWDMGGGSPAYRYHRYLGLVPDTLTLNITPNEPITGSVGFIGNTLETGTTAIAGSTYVSAGANPVMTAPLVTGITLFDVDDNNVFDVGTSCFTSIAVNLASNNRAVNCIGTLGAKDTVLGRFEATIGYSVYFANDFMLDALLAQTEYKLVVSVMDAAGNGYTLTFPRVKISSAQVAAGGSGEDVVVTGEMTALVPETPAYPMLVERIAA
jgi:hypothetical protein